MISILFKFSESSICIWSFRKFHRKLAPRESSSGKNILELNRNLCDSHDFECSMCRKNEGSEFFHFRSASATTITALLFLLNLPIYFPFFWNHGFLTLISLMVVSSDDHTMISRPFMIFFFFLIWRTHFQHSKGPRLLTQCVAMKIKFALID